MIHLVFVLMGLYFLTPELERRWGGARLLRFLALAVGCGNLFVLSGTLLPIGRETFHPPLVIGPLAAIAAITVAWAKENWTTQSRFMAVLPMSGRTLFYVSIAAAVAALFIRHVGGRVRAARRHRRRDPLRGLALPRPRGLAPPPPRRDATSVGGQGRDHLRAPR